MLFSTAFELHSIFLNGYHLQYWRTVLSFMTLCQSVSLYLEVMSETPALVLSQTAAKCNGVLLSTRRFLGARYCWSRYSQGSGKDGEVRRMTEVPACEVQRGVAQHAAVSWSQVLLKPVLSRIIQTLRRDFKISATVHDNQKMLIYKTVLPESIGILEKWKHFKSRQVDSSEWCYWVRMILLVVSCSNYGNLLQNHLQRFDEAERQ